MNDIDALLTADAQRRQAMVDANAARLLELLHESLNWTHSSGITDTRQALIESITSQAVVYQSLDLLEHHAHQEGNVFILSGTIKGDVLKGETPKVLHNRFLSVWLKGESGFRMLAWQSTGL